MEAELPFETSVNIYHITIRRISQVSNAQQTDECNNKLSRAECSTPSCSEVSGFKSRPEKRYPISSIGFSQSPGQILGQAPKLVHDCFLPGHFNSLFIIHPTFDAVQSDLPVASLNKPQIIKLIISGKQFH